MSVTHKSLTRNARLTALDLFAGCGGLSQGLKEAGFDTVAAVELDPTAVATYHLNHKDVALIEGDITRVDAAKLRTNAGLRKGDLDLLAGCPPCQGYSTLRTRNGGKQNRDRKNGLVREMLRFAREFLPKAIMMENVPGLRGKAALRDLLRGLRVLGYKVSIGVKDARHFGVAQRRRRLILVAGRGFKIPFARESDEEVSVQKVISGLRPPGTSGDPLHDLPERRSDRIRELISKIPKDGGSRAALGKQRQLRCHQDCDGFKDIYGRIAWNTVAPTITSGCFNPSKGRFLHPEEDRCITMREAALIQSFPPDYKFDLSAGKQAVALMIGNALPPEFIRQHAVTIKEAICKAEDEGRLASVRRSESR